MKQWWYIKFRGGCYLGIMDAHVPHGFIEKERGIKFKSAEDASDFIDKNLPNAKPLDWIISYE